MSLLLFFSCFPGTVAQETASCIAQCSQKCKELTIVADGERIGKDKHKKIESEMKTVRRTKGQCLYLKSISYSILRKVTDYLLSPIFVCPHITEHAYSKRNGVSEKCHILKINCILQLVSSCICSYHRCSYYVISQRLHYSPGGDISFNSGMLRWFDFDFL